MVSKAKPGPPTPESRMAPRSPRKASSPKTKAANVLPPSVEAPKSDETLDLPPLATSEEATPKLQAGDETREELPAPEDGKSEEVVGKDEPEKSADEQAATESAPELVASGSDPSAEVLNMAPVVEESSTKDEAPVAEESSTKDEAPDEAEKKEDTPSEDNTVADAGTEEATKPVESASNADADEEETKEEKPLEVSSSLFVGAPRLTAADVDTNLNQDDAAIVTEFEEAFAKYLEESSPKLLSAAQETHTTDLMREIDEIQAGKLKLKSELMEQLQFFEAGKQKVEDKYKGLLAEATKKQREEHSAIQVHLDNSQIADVHMTQAIPWENFLETLNHAVIMHKAEGESKEDSAGDSPKSSGKKTVASKAIKPSDRARFLIDSSNPDECEQSLELRAYRIDNAILNAQIRTLQNELERYEKSTETMDLIGKFLTDHNVWNILNKKAGAA